jgi:hypothetical protein
MQTGTLRHWQQQGLADRLEAPPLGRPHVQQLRGQDPEAPLDHYEQVALAALHRRVLQQVLVERGFNGWYC